ncbi:hypothetical protein LMG29542_07119 [Paraburkholderia humisilvae]|uniref:Uncharacterized protein n=1 Tax=Paraburkholderia humisilvae TaxID=627669 RepID=A0A6J5F752_9BURK|nr:hypothetical protein LMG29542_07119 [Paraburkholderia humisilvae]
MARRVKRGTLHSARYTVSIGQRGVESVAGEVTLS